MILLKGINKYYKSRHVIKDFSFYFSSNGIYVIQGDNGVGKTTLLYIIGLLDFNFEGEFYLNDININKLSKKQIREYREDNMIYIFSKGNLVPYLSLNENLYLNSKKKDRKISSNQKANTLSGGEELLLALDNAFNQNKKIYLLDEVTSNLDDNNFKTVIEKLINISASSLVIIVSHDERINSYSFTSIHL